MLKKSRNYIFGQDIFISYSRIDGSDYASSLANKLSMQKYSCFLDQWGTKPGEDLPRNLIRTLHHTKMLILLGTQNASKSKSVGKEVNEFLQKNVSGTIIPIDFGYIKSAEWYDRIRGLAIAQEDKSRLSTGEPSEKIMQRIINSFQYNKQNERLRKITQFTSLVFLLLFIAVIVSSFILSNNLKEINSINQKLDSVKTQFIITYQELDLTKKQTDSLKEINTIISQNYKNISFKNDSLNNNIKHKEIELNNKSKEITAITSEIEKKKLSIDTLENIASMNQLSIKAVKLLDRDPTLSFRLAEYVKKNSVSSNEDFNMKKCIVEAYNNLNSWKISKLNYNELNFTNSDEKLIARTDSNVLIIDFRGNVIDTMRGNRYSLSPNKEFIITYIMKTDPYDELNTIFIYKNFRFMDSIKTKHIFNFTPDSKHLFFYKNKIDYYDYNTDEDVSFNLEKLKFEPNFFLNSDCLNIVNSYIQLKDKKLRLVNNKNLIKELNYIIKESEISKNENNLKDCYDSCFKIINFIEILSKKTNKNYGHFEYQFSNDGKNILGFNNDTIVIISLSKLQILKIITMSERIAELTDKHKYSAKRDPSPITEIFDIPDKNRIVINFENRLTSIIDYEGNEIISGDFITNKEWLYNGLFSIYYPRSNKVYNLNGEVMGKLYLPLEITKVKKIGSNYYTISEKGEQHIVSLLKGSNNFKSFFSVVQVLKFSPDEKNVLLKCENLQNEKPMLDSILILNLEIGSIKKIEDIKERTFEYNDLFFSNNSQFIFSISENRMWDLNGKEIKGIGKNDIKLDLQRNDEGIINNSLNNLSAPFFATHNFDSFDLYYNDFDLLELFSGEFSMYGEALVSISKNNKYVIVNGNGPGSNEINYLLLDINEILIKFNEDKIFNEVWQLDEDSKKQYGLK